MSFVPGGLFQNPIPENLIRTENEAELQIDALMKKIIVPEVAELVCDVTGKPATASIKMEFLYGSTLHDAQVLEADLCDAVAQDVVRLLQSKYPQLKMRDTKFV